MNFFKPISRALDQNKYKINICYVDCKTFPKGMKSKVMLLACFNLYRCFLICVCGSESVVETLLGKKGN